MKTLIKKAVTGSKIFKLEKGVLDEIKDYTLNKVTLTTTSDGESIIAVTFKESEKRFFASGKFAEFITDNVECVVEKCNETDYDFSDYEIMVTYLGKKKSKNNRLYNDWKITFPAIEW